MTEIEQTPIRPIATIPLVPTTGFGAKMKKKKKKKKKKTYEFSIYLNVGI